MVTSDVLIIVRVLCTFRCSFVIPIYSYLGKSDSVSEIVSPLCTCVS